MGCRVLGVQTLWPVGMGCCVLGVQTLRPVGMGCRVLGVHTLRPVGMGWRVLPGSQPPLGVADDSGSKLHEPSSS